MKAEQAIDKSVQAGRAIQIAAMVITGLAAVSWLYFGMLYLVHVPANGGLPISSSDTRSISSLCLA